MMILFVYLKIYLLILCLNFCCLAFNFNAAIFKYHQINQELVEPDFSNFVFSFDFFTFELYLCFELSFTIFQLFENC